MILQPSSANFPNDIRDVLRPLRTLAVLPVGVKPSIGKYPVSVDRRVSLFGNVTSIALVLEQCCRIFL